MPEAKSIPFSTLIDPDNLNLAEFLEQEELDKIGQRLRKALDIDLQSRIKWEENVDDWMKLAVQYKEDKNFPWPKASNIKYPLLTTAAMQFSARAYPSLIIGKEPVKGRVVGKETPELTDISNRIAKHMSYQVMEEMPDWEEDMDKMFMILPIIGMAFKKTYYHAIFERNVSELVLPKDLVINYWARKLGGYTRKHHLLEMLPNDIYTRKARGLYLEDVELGIPRVDEFQTEQYRHDSMTEMIMPSEEDETTPYRIVECHCHYDLDKDGYLEPYIITFDAASSKILRIVPRFREESVKWSQDTKKAKVVSIEPDEYFTKYGFIPNPDGSFYDLGFGLLLGPINETINTSINQLLDQGTMYTTNGGFLGKGVRIKAGEYRFAPNEWKVLNATVDDLKKSIYPLPTREPSQVLFQMLGSLIESGQKVASIAEIFVGKMPGQNTPATTTMETVKQGMAVFTAIYKRIYRSLDEELKRLFDLNALYLDEKIDYPVDLPLEAYKQAKVTVIPTADPDVATDTEQLTKARAQLELIPLGTVDPKVVTRRVLEAMRIEGIDELMNYTPPPPPEQAQAQMEGQLKQQDAQTKQQLVKLQAQLKERDAQNKQQLATIDAQLKAQQAHQERVADALQQQLELKIDATQAAQARQQSHTQFLADQHRAEQKHKQTLRHKEEQATQKRRLDAVAAKAKPKKGK